MTPPEDDAPEVATPTVLMPLLTVGFGRLAPLLAAVVRDSLPARVLMRQRTADRMVSRLLEETTTPGFVGVTAWTPGGHLIGVGTAVQAGRRHEVRLAVQPGWRGEGVGSSLHDHVLAEVGDGRVVAWLDAAEVDVVAWFRCRGWFSVDLSWTPSDVCMFEHAGGVGRASGRP